MSTQEEPFRISCLSIVIRLFRGKISIIFIQICSLFRQIKRTDRDSIMGKLCVSLSYTKPTKKWKGKPIYAINAIGKKGREGGQNSIAKL